jgi:hypothetical protein
VETRVVGKKPVFYPEGFTPYYDRDEFRAFVKQHFDEKYWMPTHVSTEAVKATREANPGLPAKI